MVESGRLLEWAMRNHGSSWQKRQAIQIAAQLPDNPRDALAVLEYAKEIVDKFLSPNGEQAGGLRGRAAPVLSFFQSGSHRSGQPILDAKIEPIEGQAGKSLDEKDGNFVA